MQQSLETFRKVQNETVQSKISLETFKDSLEELAGDLAFKVEAKADATRCLQGLRNDIDNFKTLAKARLKRNHGVLDRHDLEVCVCVEVCVCKGVCVCKVCVWKVCVVCVCVWKVCVCGCPITPHSPIVTIPHDSPTPVVPCGGRVVVVYHTSPS